MKILRTLTLAVLAMPGLLASTPASNRGYDVIKAGTTTKVRNLTNDDLVVAEDLRNEANHILIPAGSRVITHASRVEAINFPNGDSMPFLADGGPTITGTTLTFNRNIFLVPWTKIDEKVPKEAN